MSILVLLLFSLPLLSLFIVLEDTANSPLNRQLDQQQMSSIENMLIEYDPRYLFNSNDQLIELNETESNALLLYFSQQLNSGSFEWLSDSSMLVELLPDSAKLSGSFAIKPNLFGSYLNFEASFEQANGSLFLQEIRLGEFTIPRFILRPFLNYSQQELAKNNNYLLLNSVLASIKRIEIKENYLGLTVNWGTVDINLISEQARRLLIDQTTYNNLITYQRHLISVLNEVPDASRSISLNVLLAPLFSYALENDGDPREENQAIFLILSCYLLDELDIEDLVGSDALETTITRPLRITLESRDDLPRHMIASAAIAAYANNDLANMLSIYKEVQDSRSYSGFSFSDITANQIGSRMGELASTNPNAALQLQRFFSEMELEIDYMPLVGRPDGISEAEFIAQYGNRNSEAYLNRMESIKNTIELLPIFQDL
ncbi:hypothetical protein JYT97_01275 [Haliea sp. AH-315-K21]|nr:hypothetical protein [Haliea sp. AH-315-K21]MBN4075552.1 hypothetical protein [Gammaproteobacteria bacterium AH-315-E17]